MVIEWQIWKGVSNSPAEKYSVFFGNEKVFEVIHQHVHIIPQLITATLIKLLD